MEYQMGHMRKIRIRKDSDGNIRLDAFAVKRATEEIAENESVERTDDFDVREEFLVMDKTADEES